MYQTISPSLRSQTLLALLQQPPQASATVSGSAAYRTIHGSVQFYQTRSGVLVFAEVTGLPASTSPCQQPIFGFHIHSGGQCSGNGNNPFAGAQGHYNPNNCPHPYHAGDLPPLFGHNGRAFMVFLTGRFFVRDIIGKTVIIHAQPDDFTTQPSGNAGAMIACGVIRANSPGRS